MTFEALLELITGEAGVVVLLLGAVIVFFRGGIVTGKAHERAMTEMKESLERERQRTSEASVESTFWRTQALGALRVAEGLRDRPDLWEPDK